jgi:phosphatidylserine synthase
MDRLTLKRSGQVLAPSIFTVGNMACGFYALLAAHRDDFVPAATAILAGILFDALDGRVARLVHGESTFGVEFDSLSDFLTFGIAPAHMIYYFILKDYGVWGWKFLMDQVPALYGLAPAMVIVLAFLMVSTIPYPAFKQPNVFQPRSLKTLFGVVISALLIFVYPTNILFLIFLVYALLGPVGWIVRLALSATRGPKPASDGSAPGDAQHLPR